MSEFKFPEKEELKIFLKDILEKDVDEKYYLSDEQTKKLLTNPNVSNFRTRNFVKGNICQTLQSAMSHGNTIPLIYISSVQKHNTVRDDGISNSLPSAMGMGGGHTPMIVASRGRNPENLSDRTPGNYTEQRLEPKFDGTSNAITTVQKDNYVYENYRIRKLTPKECFRLMGFLDDEINLYGLSNTQKYKLAGNGWDINLVAKIFKAMNIPDGTKSFEMFAGDGGGSFGLKKAGIRFECIGFSEVDKYAIQCYSQNHNGKNYGDCSKIDPKELNDFGLLTAGFPCQSFSNAGKGLGEQDTRGTLFYDIIRVAEVKKPKYMFLENVKGLTNKKHKQTFEKILSELERIGYDVYWKILNSKEHGIPQNRERVFFVCFRKDLGMGREIKQTTL